MTLLQIMSDVDATDIRLRTEDRDLIRAEMAARGIGFGQWALPPQLTPSSATEDILAEFASHIGELTATGGYRHVDVARIHSNGDPASIAMAEAARAKFLDEHRHAEDEVRFFVAGSGCFYLHLGEEVCALVCTAGDLVSVPAGTAHWFDMGASPEFIAIRFFQEADGWIGDFSGDPIAGDFPTLDELRGSR